MNFQRLLLCVILLTGITIPSITSSAETRPSFNADVLNIPELQIGSEIYTLNLNLIDPSTLTLQVDMQSLKNIINSGPIGDITASYEEGSLLIPQLLVGNEIYSVKLNLVDSNTLTVQVNPLSILKIGVDTDSLFNKLDSVLAQKVVSTNSPEGLWLIYSHGSTELSFNNGGNPGTNEKDIHLHAFVISVYLVNGTGELSIQPAGCIGSEFTNRVLVNRAIHTDATINQFPITFQQLKRMSGANFPYRAGDLVEIAGTDFKGFVDTEINVSVINNREMIFDRDFTFTDAEGENQGSFTTSFKGRKIADDFTTKLGQFSVNNETMDIQCYTYTNLTDSSEGESTINNQVFITKTQLDFEYINISSNLGLEDGISSMLYQKTGEVTQVTNGESSFGQEQVSISVNNTSNLFNDISVFSQIASDIVDYSLIKLPDTSFDFTYTISKGENSEALSGKVELDLW